jgi:hypothetical protein
MTVRIACPARQMGQIGGVRSEGGSHVGYRRFTDPEGHEWEVRDVTRSSWEFHPVPGNPGKILSIDAPGYEADPFELSVEELQRLLGKPGGPGHSRPSRSPFKD